jgi:hypothetical protein
MNWLRGALLVLPIAAQFFSVVPEVDVKALPRDISVLADPGLHSFKVVAGDVAGAVVTANFDDSLGTTGWSQLRVRTGTASASNAAKAYAAGYAEGLLTHVRISQFYANLYGALSSSEAVLGALQNIKYAFKDSLEFVRKNANLVPGAMALEPVDPYWKQMRYAYLQMLGLMDAYNFAAVTKGVHSLTLVDMFVINRHDELPDLLAAFAPDAIKARRASKTTLLERNSFLSRVRQGAVTSTVQVSDTKPNKLESTRLQVEEAVDRDWERRMATVGHCSAFVRLAPENIDLLAGHATWTDYGKMTRIWKVYDFAYTADSWTKASSIAMSSYPGCISSTDNWLELSSGLLVMDTALSVLNPRVYDRTMEQSVIPSFLHTLAVSRMATTGAHWATLYSESNSGSHNAQWMIIDFKAFTPGKPIGDGVLTVMEEIPGLTRSTDMSAHLARDGMWMSFDRPYFSDIRDATGHTAAQALHGALFSYSANPRAQIMSTVGSQVSNLAGMRALMRRNKFPKEGVIPGEPGHAVAARLDLDGWDFLPNGAIDAKVTNRCLALKLTAQAISGPTHDDQPVFQWEDASGKPLFPGWPHMGLPNKWNFEWEQVSAVGTGAVEDQVC